MIESCKKLIIVFLVLFLLFILIKKFKKSEPFQQIPTTTNLSYIAFTNPTGDIQAVDKNAVFTRGMIMAWSGSLTVLPTGWALCNGTNGTPDLRGRFILSYNDNPTQTSLTERKYNPLEKSESIGGAETHKLTKEETPLKDHLHSFGYGGAGSGSGQLGGPGDGYPSYPTAFQTNTSTNGSADAVPHNNMPPYYVLAYIMKL